MLRSTVQLITLVLATTLTGCAPPELTTAQEDLVRRCLELAYKQETNSDCAQVTKPVERAFLEKHPDFYDRLLAERKIFVEERIAEDRRRRDELNACVEDREAGNTSSPACEEFTEREITRVIEDRRRRRCAEAQLDGKADAQRYCGGLSHREIEDEVQMERVRRERGG